MCHSYVSKYLYESVCKISPTFIKTIVGFLCALPAVGSAHDSALLAQWQKAHPTLMIRAIEPTPIDRLWAVTIADEVAYAVTGDDRSLRYLLVGAKLVDLKTRTDLTASVRERAQKIDVKALPLADAITEKRGSGRHVLYVFSDIDCGHCRRLQLTLDALTDVTIHTFLTPIGARIDPKRAEKSALVWCASDRAQALHRAMRGEALEGLAGCETPLWRNLRLAQSLHIRGTPTIFFADGSRVIGNRLKLEDFKARFRALP